MRMKVKKLEEKEEKTMQTAIIEQSGKNLKQGQNINSDLCSTYKRKLHIHNKDTDVINI